MLPLFVLAVLQCAAYFAMGEGMISDIPPNFGERLAEEDFDRENEPIFLSADDPLSADYNKKAQSVRDRSQSFKPRGLSFSKWSKRLSKKGLPIIKRFAEDYIQSVKSSKKLRKAYEVRRFNAETLSSFFYEYTYGAHLTVGNPDAEVAAQFVGLAVGVNFDKIRQRRDNFLCIFAYFVSNTLFYRGYLNESNVDSVFHQYYSFTATKMNSIEKFDHEENMKAVCDAHFEFLTYVGLIDNVFGMNLISGAFASQVYAYEM